MVRWWNIITFSHNKYLLPISICPIDTDTRTWKTTNSSLGAAASKCLRCTVALPNVARCKLNCDWLGLNFVLCVLSLSSTTLHTGVPNMRPHFCTSQSCVTYVLTSMFALFVTVMATVIALRKVKRCLLCHTSCTISALFEYIYRSMIRILKVEGTINMSLDLVWKKCGKTKAKEAV